ncbi:MAG: hypothetical protein FJ335_12115 [Sphingomonadales bacterium]|nr:hypothetical protein [Sphingomonadales bacterium]
MQAGLSLTWDAFCADTRCEACGGPVSIRMRMFVSDQALRTGDIKRALVFKALCVLEEAIVDSRKGRVRPSLGLRFALAYLYAVGDRRKERFDREPYVAFWQAATKQSQGSSDTSGVGRRGMMQASLNGIARAAGIEITPDVNSRLRAAVGADVDTPPRRQAASNDV